MAVIVPNAANASPGQRYEVLNQSEPDSLDFEILGNVGRSGVLLGCEVTAGNGNNVQVSAGVVVLNGVPYTYVGGSSLLPSAPVGGADKRYDIVVARVVGNNVEIAFVRGAERDTNFAYPPSRSVLTQDILYDPSTVVDLNNEVVLAAIYRANNTATIRSHIVDKRAAVSSSIPNQGTSDPAPQVGALGDLYFRSTPSGPTSSGVFVRRSNEWVPVASEPQAGSGPYVPIGGMLAWPSRVSVPTGYVEANGQALSASSYSELYAVYGDTHGEDLGAGTFNVPNLNNRVPRGTTSLSSVGNNVGSDAVSLTEDNLPSHSHSLNNHTHTLSHTHTINHDHPSTVSTAPAHSHGMNHSHTASQTPHSHTINNHTHSIGHGHGNNFEVVSAGQHTHVVNRDVVARFGDGNRGLGSFTAARPLNITGLGGTKALAAGAHVHSLTGGVLNHSGNSGDPSNRGTNPQAPVITVNQFSGATNLGGSHTHAITVNGFNGDSGPASNNVTSQATGNTGETGSNDPVSTVPSASLVRWIIRAK